jgi:hypothetical protein
VTPVLANGRWCCRKCWEGAGQWSPVRASGKCPLCGGQQPEWATTEKEATAEANRFLDRSDITLVEGCPHCEREPETVITLLCLCRKCDKFWLHGRHLSL